VYMQIFFGSRPRNENENEKKKLFEMYFSWEMRLLG
jgi:hypothetical protein